VWDWFSRRRVPIQEWDWDVCPSTLVTRSGRLLEIKATKAAGGGYEDVWLAGEGRMVFRGVAHLIGLSTFAHEFNLTYHLLYEVDYCHGVPLVSSPRRTFASVTATSFGSSFTIRRLGRDRLAVSPAVTQAFQRRTAFALQEAHPGPLRPRLVRLRRHRAASPDFVRGPQEPVGLRPELPLRRWERSRATAPPPAAAGPGASRTWPSSRRPSDAAFVPE